MDVGSAAETATGKYSGGTDDQPLRAARCEVAAAIGATGELPQLDERRLFSDVISEQVRPSSSLRDIIIVVNRHTGSVAVSVISRGVL